MVPGPLSSERSGTYHLSATQNLRIPWRETQEYAFLLSFLGWVWKTLACENYWWRHLKKQSYISKCLMLKWELFFKALKTKWGFYFWPKWSNKNQISPSTWSNNNKKDKRKIEKSKSFQSIEYQGIKTVIPKERENKEVSLILVLREFPSCSAGRRNPDRVGPTLWVEMELRTQEYQGARVYWAEYWRGENETGAILHSNKGLFWMSFCQQIQQLD